MSSNGRTRREPSAEGVGAYLRRARQAKNITLEQVAHITKINIAYLYAIENDEFDKLPAPAFARGFLRLYAQCVGVDPDEIVLRFNRTLQDEEHAASHDRTARRLRLSWKLVAACAIGGVCLVVLLVLTSTVRKIPEAPVQETRPAPPRDHVIEEPVAISEPQDQEVVTDVPSEPKEQEDQKNDEHGSVSSVSSATEARQETPQPVVLLVHAHERTWLRVVIDHRPPFEVMLQPGDQVRWDAAEKVRLRIGNAGGIRITCNGVTMERLGKSGEVIEREFPTPSE